MSSDRLRKARRLAREDESTRAWLRTAESGHPPNGSKVRLSLTSLLHNGFSASPVHASGRSRRARRWAVRVVAVPLRRGPRVVARPGRLDAVQLQRQAKPRADAVSLVGPAERGAVRLERAVGGEDGAVLERFTVHRPKLTSVARTCGSSNAALITWLDSQ